MKVCNHKKIIEKIKQINYLFFIKIVLYNPFKAIIF